MATRPSLRRASPRAARGRARRIALTLSFAAIAASLAAVPMATDAHGAGPRAVTATLRPPVTPFRAARLFDRPDTPWGAGHRGIDITAQVGDTVVSPSGGIVTFAGTVVDRGVVTVDAGGGLLSSVEPVIPGVAVGAQVSAGDALGTVSAEPGHCAPVVCVHWGVRRDGGYVNPLDVLAGYGRIILLP